MVIFGSIINKGYHCGCRKLLQEDELYKDKPTVLYYIKIGTIYKIGLAMLQKHKNEERAIEARYRGDIKLGLEYEIVSHKLYEDGYEALQMERKILQENLNSKYNGDKISSPNTCLIQSTELFLENIFKTVIGDI